MDKMRMESVNITDKNIEKVEKMFPKGLSGNDSYKKGWCDSF